jgi:hypothetical protein
MGWTAGMRSLREFDEMLKNLDENDLKVIYRIVRSFRG